MRLHYGLEEAGWVTVSLQCADQQVDMAASYLHDSLRNLVSATRALVDGAPEVTVIFMDEPGEHQLVMRRTAQDTIEAEVLWYDDWKSWDMYSGPGARRFLAVTPLAHVREQVLSELRRLLAEYGEAGYRKKWIEHEFPTTEMQDLESTE